MSDPLIIIGASARAAAQSAIRAGYAPWCIDLFADIDLQAIAPVKRCPRGKWPHGIPELMEDAPPGPVLFTGAMENQISVTRSILSERQTIGSSIDGMTKVRSPRYIGEIPAIGLKRLWQIDPEKDPQGFMFIPQRCRTYERPPWHAALSWSAASLFGFRFLVKPRASGGGRGIRSWSPFSRVRSNEYVQRHIHGRPISAVFFATEGRSAILGISEQLVGDHAFGANGFEYVGNIGPARLSSEAVSQLRFVGLALAGELTGVFGVDAILVPVEAGRQGIDLIYPIEVNPRYVASVEVFERITGIPCLAPFENHAAALNSESPSIVVGKAVVYARQQSIVPDLWELFGRDNVADVPAPGDRVKTGQPVCTVFAQGATRKACYAGLREMAEKVYTRLQPA